MEEWKDIKGYEGMYRISNKGNLYSYKSNRLLNIQKTKKGYAISIISNQGAKGKVIHRLVASAFIPNPENKPQVNHKDGNKLNNNVENLEWCTGSENVQHAQDNNLSASVKGIKNSQSKLTDQAVLDIRETYKINPKTKLKTLAEKYKVTQALISLIKNNKGWKHI